MKKIELYLFAIVLTGALFIGSCDLEKEPIPAYLHIKPFTITTNSNEGTKEHKITDAWVSVVKTGDFLGVYELPATLPIIADGNIDLIIAPGILENGIRVTPDMYPMMTEYEVSVDFAPNEIDTIQPSTTYDSRVKFHYQEDFDGSNTLNEVIDSTIMVYTSLISDSLVAFEGSSVKFVLDEDNPKMEVATETFMELETVSEQNPTFLEMHYKNEGILQVALLGYEDLNSKPTLTYFFALNPQSDWNKIYINLTDQLIAHGSQIKNFRVLFGAQLPDGETTSTYLIDNLKVVELQVN